MTQLIGQTVGRYQIIEQLGQGGMACVYKALDMHTERIVALKAILPNRVLETTFTKRFDREARVLANLSHPNIVRISDFGKHNGIPYLVMDYVAGGTLKQKVGKPMPWYDAAKLLAPVARALEYAHSRGVVHRDIKPANILITESGEAMLSDFGIAKILESEETSSLTGTGVGVGTPEYMAPEQVTGAAVDVRADVYSLGIVFYELVTGRKPFQADTPLAVAIKQATEPIPPPRKLIPDLPEMIEHIIFKALAKKPENRYQSMSDFAQVLDRLAAEGVVGHHTESKAPTARKPAFWKWVTAMVVVGVALLGSRSVWLVRNAIPLPAETPVPPTIVSGAAELPPTLTATTPTLTATQRKQNATLAATSTPVVTPTAIGISSAVHGAVVTYRSHFSGSNLTGWQTGTGTPVANGILTVSGTANAQPITRDGAVRGPGAIVVKFRHSADASFSMSIESGERDTASYRRWGIRVTRSADKNKPAVYQPDVYQDMQQTPGPQMSGDLQTLANQWYWVILQAGSPTTEFVGMVWDPQHPELYLEMRQKMDANWEGQDWSAAIDASAGIVEVEQYEELSGLNEDGNILRVGLLDDFNDPDPRLDPEKWEAPSNGCTIVKQLNALEFSLSKPLQEWRNCDIKVYFPRDVPARLLRSLEFRVKGSPNVTTKGMTIGVINFTRGLPGGDWSSFCGLEKPENHQPNAVFSMANFGAGGEMDIRKEVSVSPENWHMFRMIIDTKSLTFYCYLGTTLVGQVQPRDSAALRQAEFSQALMGSWDAGATDPMYVDDVRILP